MKSVLMFWGAVVICWHLASCRATPAPPKTLPADTLELEISPWPEDGYLQEVRLPSGTRCVVYRGGRVGGVDCEFQREPVQPLEKP